MHQVNKRVITTSRLTQVSHWSVEGQSGELWESPTYRTPKVTCRRVQRPETKKMLLMRWLWVRLSYWRHSLSERMRGIETVAPNAVRRCCKVKERNGRETQITQKHKKHKWSKAVSLFSQIQSQLLKTNLKRQENTEVPGRGVSHEVGEFVSVPWWRTEVMWLLLPTLRFCVCFSHRPQPGGSNQI